MEKSILAGIFKKVIVRKKANIDASKLNRILVLRLGAMGDVVRTTPMLRELRRMVPNARIDYLVSGRVSEVLEGNPNVDRIIRLNGQIYGLSFQTIATFYRAARRIRKEKYDLMINLEPHYFSQFFTLMCGIPIVIGWDRAGEGFALNNKVEYDGRSNEIYKALETLKFIGRYRKNADLEIYIGKKEREFARKELSKARKGRLIAIAPGATRNQRASETIRRWPEERYRELSERLARMGYTIVFVGDRHDKGVIKKVSGNLKKGSYIDTSGKTTIKEMAAIIGMCDLFISHDSGPMHIAAAVKTPIIALFGSTEPRRAAPLTKNSIVIYKRRKNEPLQYDIYGRYINTDMDYLKRISVEEVISQVKKPNS